MKIFGIVLLCCAILVNGQDPVNPTEVIKDDTTVPPSTTTTTTTEKPPRTTTSPTTTTTSTTTTTEKTTPAPPPPPPAPPAIPAYPKNSGKWSISNSTTNVTCVLLKAALQINVVEKNKTYTVDVPSNEFSNASGSCGEPEVLTITWNSAIFDNTSQTFFKNQLTFTFVSNNSKLTADSGITVGKFGLQTVSASLHLNNSDPDTPVTLEAKDIDTFQTPLNHSYSCLAEEVIKSATGDFILKIREVQLEAYRSDASGHQEFSAAVQCPADDATDVVPIAVGAALAGLVVIVLIAYLIGRKRSRARGYQSV